MALAIAATLVVVAPGVARAFVSTTTPAGHQQRWPIACVALHVHLADLPGVPADDVRAAALAAAAAWSSPTIACTDLQIALSFESGPGPSPDDATARAIGTRRDGWCDTALPPGSLRSCNDPSAVAVTSVFADNDSGRIRGANVQFNSRAILWARLDARGKPSTKQDLESALTHEMGHLLGLAHPCWGGVGPRAVTDTGAPEPDCYGADDAVLASVMFRSTEPGVVKRALSADDRRAICTLYPRAVAATVCPAEAAATADTGCALVSGRPTRPVIVVVGLLLLARGLKRRRSSRHRSRSSARGA